MSADRQFLTLCRVSVVMAFVITVLPASIITAESIFTAVGAPWLTAGIENIIGATLCHHLPSRTITVGATPMPVCARCAGLYIGFVLGTLVASGWPLRQHADYGGLRVLMIVLAIGAIVATSQAILEAIGFLVTSNSARLLLGLPLGTAPSAAMLCAARVLNANVFGERRAA